MLLLFDPYIFLKWTCNIFFSLRIHEQISFQQFLCPSQVKFYLEKSLFSISILAFSPFAFLTPASIAQQVSSFTALKTLSKRVEDEIIKWSWLSILECFLFAFPSCPSKQNNKKKTQQQISFLIRMSVGASTVGGRFEKLRWKTTFNEAHSPPFHYAHNYISLFISHRHSDSRESKSFLWWSKKLTFISMHCCKA